MIKIDSCLIIKNEIENIEKLVRQLERFSHKICIAETGSTDGTAEWLEEEAKRNDKIVLAKYEWTMDFAAARNFSWSLSTDADYRFWCDGDDLLSEALIEDLTAFTKMELNDDLPDIVYMRYLYTPNLELYRLRMAKTTCPEIVWAGFIHEYLQYTAKHKKLTINGEDKYIEHHHVKDPGDKYRNFNHFNANNITKTRDVFYFGRECNILQMPLLSGLLFIEALKKGDDWDANLISALCDLKTIQQNYKYKFTDKWYDFVEKLYKKCEEKDFKRCDLSFLMGYYYLYIKKNITKAIKYYKESYELRDKDQDVNDFLIDRNLGKIGSPLDLCVIYANHKKQFKTAKEWNDIALSYDPTNPNIKNNDEVLQEIIKEEEEEKKKTSTTTKKKRSKK
jgi:hypothetical protein